MRRLGLVAGGVALLCATASARETGMLTVASSAFNDGGIIPSEYTCEGRSVSPPISWTAVPPDTKSIAVLVDDPDAPRGTFEHLALLNLPPTERALVSMSGTSPMKGMAARNSGGTTGFAPICPPSGRHHYRFQVLALDTRLNLPASASAEEVASAMKGHVLARGELTGTYQRGAK